MANQIKKKSGIRYDSTMILEPLRNTL